MKDLTQKQSDVLQFIIDFKKQNEYPPTFREIADAFKITVHAAYDCVKSMKKKGHITYTEKISRSIRVLEGA